MNTDQILYYAQRAEEYEKIYDKPERAKDIKKVAAFLKETFAGKNVLEVACGTGYWTKFISETAATVLATDINQAVIEIAKAKTYKHTVNFAKADVYRLEEAISNTFNAVFGGFIWSHIPKQDLPLFLATIYSRIATGGTVLFIDNLFVPGSSTPIADNDEFGNTYQIRELKDGTRHKVMKNFPADAAFIEAIKPAGTAIEIRRLDYFWILQFRVK